MQSAIAQIIPQEDENHKSNEQDIASLSRDRAQKTDHT